MLQTAIFNTRIPSGAGCTRKQMNLLSLRRLSGLVSGQCQLKGGDMQFGLLSGLCGSGKDLVSAGEAKEVKSLKIFGMR